MAHQRLPAAGPVYDVPTGRLSPLAALERPLARAAEILGR